MSDVSDFLRSYDETLRQGVSVSDMPPGLTEWFSFDSCVKQRDGRAVYFVAQRSDGRRAVLRITDAPDLPNPPTAPDEASRSSGDNAAAEGAILARLNHPAIPKVLGAWEYNGRGYLAREYFEGDDLGTYVRRHGPLSRERLLDITLQLCDVLTYIHSQSPAVIHRDIKPENIILSAGNSVKLIDFGIARDFKPDTNMSRDTQVAGTRPYMAPEQFGSEQTDGRADIYALGVVMIYVATGKPDKTNLRASYPYKELMPLIETCIRKDRDQRFKTAAQLKRRILWIRQRITQKILLVAGACALVAVAFVAGLLIGQAQGFTRGVDSIMDVPTYKNRPFTPDELYEPVTFDNWYIDMAVRVTLNKTPEDTIYRNDVVSHIDKIVIYGTHILHPSLDVKLIKTHLEKDAVSYMTDDGFTVERGDISSLDDIPTMYYLRSLTLTSQSITDLSPLSGMKLEEVNLTDNYVGNLLPLKDMVTLRELDVSQNPLRDLTPISRLLSLTSLDISQTQVTDLAPLRELTKLETLKLAYCDVRDISVLAKMPDLQEVDVSNTLVTDLSPLVRPGNPVTVRCVGLPKEVVDKVRDKTGIVIIDQPSENQR